MTACEDKEPLATSIPNDEQFNMLSVGMSESSVVEIVGKPTASVIIDPISSSQLFILVYHQPEPGRVLFFKEDSLSAVYIEQERVLGDGTVDEYMHKYFEEMNAGKD